MIDVGVAYFDSPKNLNVGGGWCSLNGEKAKMFASSSSDLDPKVLWITNLDYEDYKEASFSGTSHIRNENFFRLPLKKIGTEIGVYSSTKTPETVELLSGVASKTINLAGESMPGLRFSGFSLSESIYIALGLLDIKNDPAARFQSEYQAAFQEFSVITSSRRGFSGETEIVRFIPNRILHAEHVLSYSQPAGDLRVIEGDMSVNEFLSLENPAIAEATVDNSNAEFADLIAFGSQYSSSRVMRTHVTQAEVFFMLSVGSKFALKNTIVFSSSSMPPQLPEKLTSNAFVRNSYAGGLLADNFLSSLMSKRRLQGTRIKTPHFFPSRAVHIRSVDRMLSFEMAKALFEAGLRIVDYGFGVVSVRVSFSEMPTAMMIGADLGFSILATPSDSFWSGN